ncbi:hypothetical protein GALMADRAFT_238509 [Galerina marginata CBS 339.88]|uniref:Uncharacterized protein n=1 Tax=Galerina marginata (strain CBS 339.88) TaxID=685588 RepID=A0A067TI25_GALM3|nr:hypothetical protein GALMADRAFT_238509 [Galerina marginata CBS 339.88]
MSDLIAALSVLPAEVNRFTFVAEFLTGSYILPNPKWVHGCLWALFFAYVLAFVLTATGLVAKALHGDFHLAQFKGGLLVPNASVLYCIFEGIFITLFAIDLMWQIRDDDLHRAATGRLALFGIQWSYFWIGGFCFTMSTISWTLKVGPLLAATDAGTSTAWATRSTETSRRWLVYAVDFFGILLPVAHIISITTIFVFSNAAFANAVNYMEGMVVKLTAAAPTYNAAKFNLTTDLLPMLADVAPMMAETNRFVNLSGWGYGLLSFYCLLSLAIWLPFFFHLRGSLLNLMRSSHTLTVGSQTMITPVVEEKVRAHYHNMIWVNACILLKDIAYGGVALCVAVKPGFVTDPVYNIIATLLSAGIFAFVGNYIAFLIAWRAIQRLRETRSPQSSRSMSKPAGFGSISIPLQATNHGMSTSSIAMGDDKPHDYPRNHRPRINVEKDVHIHVSLSSSPGAEKEGLDV